ncbi:MAG: hypothetical protein WC242_01720 [Candidatus Paceibacterota bacterium]|jgi:hypothetical protein
MKVDKKVTFVWLLGLSVIIAIAVLCAQLIAKDIGIMAFVAASACMALFALDNPLENRNKLFFLNMIVLLLNGIIFLFCPPIRYISLIILSLDALYIFSFKSYRKVRKNTFVILGNRVLVPGERFYLWPFFSYNIGVFNKEKDWDSSLCRVNTKDGDFIAKVKAEIVFDIPNNPVPLESSPITADGLSKIVSQRIKEIAREFASGKTLSEIIGKKTTQALQACPVIGIITIEFLGLSVVKP